MIPKLIHYSWFSGEPYPEFLKECMDTWKKVLPDYEFMLGYLEQDGILVGTNYRKTSRIPPSATWAITAKALSSYLIFS